MSLERKKGRSVVTENPKGGSLKILEGGGPLKFAWKMKTWEGGSRKSSKVIRGHQFSEVAFKGEMFCLAQNPPPPQAINNDRPLRTVISIGAIML